MHFGIATDTREIPLIVVKCAKMRLLICGNPCVMIKIENDSRSSA